MLAGLRLHLVAFLAERAAGGEGPGDLVVQFDPVGDDHKSPVAGLGAQHLLRKIEHREALARALGMPEDAEPAARFDDPVDCGDGAVDAEKLVVFGELLDEPALALFVGDKVLDEVEQPLGLADAADRGFEPGGRRLVLALGLFPLDEMLKGRVGRTDFGLDAVRDDDRGVVDEDLRDVVAVAADIVVEGVADVLARPLQFDQQQRDAVDKADQIGAALVKLALKPGLPRDQEIVGVRVAPIDEAGDLGPALAFGPAQLHRHAVLEQPVDFGIGVGREHHPPVARDLGGGVAQGVSRQMRVEPPECCPQPVRQQRLAHAGATLAAAGAECFALEVGVAPTQRPEQLDGRPFDRRTFRKAGVMRCAFGERKIAAHRHLRQNGRDGFDKPARRIDAGTGKLGRNIGIGAGLVIGNGFQIIGAAEEGLQLRIEGRLVLHQAPQRVAHPAMPLDDPTGALDDHRVGRVQPGEIGRAAGLVGPVVGQHVLRLQQKFAGLVEEGGGFRGHKSTPSERSASINGVRAS